MGLELLRKEIMDGAHRKAKALEHGANEQARELLHNAHLAAKKTGEAAIADAKAFVESERAERLSAARLEAHKMLSEAREAAVNAALEMVWLAFVSKKRGSNYRATLKALAGKAVAELGISRPVLHANAADRKLLSSMGYRVAATPLECEGGAAAETSDGRIRSDYTLEEVFGQQKEGVRKELYARLFGGEEDMPSEIPATEKKKAGGRKKPKAGGKRSGRRKPLN